MRTYYVVQTPNQMRNPSRASVDNVPAKAVIFLPGCSGAGSGSHCNARAFLVWSTGPLTLHFPGKGNVIEQPAAYQPPAYIETWFVALICSTPLFLRHVCQRKLSHSIAYNLREILVLRLRSRLLVVALIHKKTCFGAGGNQCSPSAQPMPWL